jgi:preprotein translocase subunit SecA
LQSLNPEQAKELIQALGRRSLTEIYRQLLLGVITELWVDYLTQMEALRVSIGLEAYAQRDPLVQYKSRASELFQNLLRDMRLGVITRMFTYRPRDSAALQFGLRRSPEGELEAVESLPEVSEPVEEAVEEMAGEEDEEAPEESQPEEAAAGRASLSRSQKRRRRRH